MMASGAAAKRGMFIDIAANLTDCVFRGVDWKGRTIHADDFDAVLARAQAAGVDKIIVSGTSLDVSHKAVELCRAHKGLLYCTVGVHPAHADDFLLPSRIPPPPKKSKKKASQKKPAGTGDAGADGTAAAIVAPSTAPQIRLSDGSPEQVSHTARLMKELRDLIAANRDCVVAVGEIGLDYAELNHAVTPALQRDAFLLQLQMALDFDLPLFLHSRECGMDFAEALSTSEVGKAIIARGGCGVVHSFNGSKEELASVLGMGFDVGVNASAFRSEVMADLIVTDVPPERLLIETDAPWCDFKQETDFGAKYVSTWPRANPKTAFSMGDCVERRNEPRHIVQIAEAYVGHAAAKGVAVTMEQAVAQFRANAARAFPGVSCAASATEAAE